MSLTRKRKRKQSGTNDPPAKRPLQQLIDNLVTDDPGQLLHEGEDGISSLGPCLERLVLALPQRLLASALTYDHASSSNGNKQNQARPRAGLLFSSPSFTSPSFCIGRFSLSLTCRVNIHDLLSLTHSKSGENSKINVTLHLMSEQLEIWCADDTKQGIFLPVIANPPFTKWNTFIRSQTIYTTGGYLTQLVLPLLGERNNGVREGRGDGKVNDEDSKRGDKESNKEVVLGAGKEEEGKNGGDHLPASDSGYVEIDDNDDKMELSVKPVSQLAVTEDEVNTMSVVDKDRQNWKNEDEDGGGEGVMVEVWVGGDMCEPVRDPNSPPRTSSKMITAFNGLLEAFQPGITLESNPPKPDDGRGTMGGRRYVSIAARIEQFYREVQKRRRELSDGSEPEFDTSVIAGLTADLRGYQKKAVQWMLDRERGVDSDQSSILHPLWKEFQLSSSDSSHQTIYFNRHTGRLTDQRYSSHSLPRGGILADEMGLGKTVEVLALVMANRAPSAPPAQPQSPPLVSSLSHNSSANAGQEFQDKESGQSVSMGVVQTHNHSDCSSSSSPAEPASSSQVPMVVEKEKEVAEVVDEEEEEEGNEVEVVEVKIEEDMEEENEEVEVIEVKMEEGGEVEVVECVCGATREESDDGREYVQCDKCQIWFHSNCVQFRSSQQSSFVCIKCHLEVPLQSKATLIISPESILQQWREEIIKHTSPNALSVLHYEGVKYGFVSPYELAKHDIVLVSYETLSLELNYAKSHEVSRSLRFKKRYTSSPSPLPAVNWWRVCLDEAQMVESAVTRPAEMCLRLRTHHRWCVTGTPVQRDLNDLYGLVLFLELEPYSQSLWYRRLITQPYLQCNSGPLVNLFSRLMWRNNQRDVTQELQLPEHTEKTHLLSFSLVEKYFYRKQKEVCRNEARKGMSWWSKNTTLERLTKETVNKIMTPLHSLRRACCHPQMVNKGGYLTISHKKSLTMGQLLEKLVVQAKVEAREGLRKSIFALNGIAGLHILKEEWDQARETYEQAIAMWTEYKEKEVECDKVQQLHTVTNLAWLLEQGYCLSSPSDDSTRPSFESLREKAEELRVQFLSKAENQVRTAALAVVTCKAATRNSLISERRDAVNQSNSQSVQESSPLSANQRVQGSSSLADQDTNSSADHSIQEESHSVQCVSSSVDHISSSSPSSIQNTVQNTCSVQNTSSVQDTLSPSNLDIVSGQDQDHQPSLHDNGENSSNSTHSSSLQDTTAPSNQQGNSSPSEHDKPSSSIHQNTPSSIQNAVSSVQDSNSSGNQNNDPIQQNSSTPNDNVTSETGSADDVEEDSDKNHPISLWDSQDDISIQTLMTSVIVAVGLSDRQGSSKAYEQLLNTVRSHLTDGGLNHSFSLLSLSSIQLILSMHFHKLQESRAESLKALNSLLVRPTQDQVEHAYDCHLSIDRDERRGWCEKEDPCDFCLAENVLVHYGSQLFSHYSSNNSMGQEHGEGSRSVHPIEKIIRAFVNFLRHKCKDEELLRRGRSLVAYVEAIKKEYDVMTTLWQYLDKRVAQYDELRLAMSRMRFMTMFEIGDGTDDPSAVHPSLCWAKKAEFEAERVEARNELTRSLGQIVYLKNLAKTPEGETEQESCPICTREFGKEIDEWGILPCGHPLCMECVFEMTRRASYWVALSSRSPVVRLSCPLCRFSCLSSEINTIRPYEHEHLENMSTKIRGVVHTLQSIQSQSPLAKTLVFSSWLETLNLVSSSLTEHEITHCYINNPKSFQENLSKFKTSNDINVLLMPLSSGSKGLNIVEASHVILVEPGLNLGAELQAIGRIHRIGQTKPTTVHRLVIEDTVEEKIRNILSSSSNSQDTLRSQEEEEEEEHTLTLGELETLFE